MKAVSPVFWILWLLGAACSPGSTTNSQPSDPRKATLDALGQHILDKGKVLGYSVCIDSAGSTSYTGNFGHIDVAKTKAIDDNTRFDMASVSKMIGVSVIMNLVEQRKLSLNQSLEELLPAFPEKALARKIQLKHLISHTSGLWDITLEVDSVFMATKISPGRQDFFDALQGKDLLFEPGSNYQYSNIGFILMAFIAEDAAHVSWQELIDEIVNEPTGLDFQLMKYAVDLPDTSPIFNPQEEGFKKLFPWTYVMGDGGLTATAQMLSKFPAALIKGDIISKSSFEIMTKPQSLLDTTYTGYGFGVRNGYFLGEKIIGHTGGFQSTYALLAYFPERELTFAGLMNTDNTSEDIYSIFTQFMSAFLDKSPNDFSKAPKPFERPQQLVGTYHGYGDEFDNKGTTVSISLGADKQLQYCIDDSCEALYYMGQNRFWLKKYPFDYIEFQIEEQAIAIREYYYGFFQVLRKRQYALP